MSTDALERMIADTVPPRLLGNLKLELKDIQNMTDSRELMTYIKNAREHIFDGQPGTDPALVGPVIVAAATQQLAAVEGREQTNLNDSATDDHVAFNKLVDKAMADASNPGQEELKQAMENVKNGIAIDAIVVAEAKADKAAGEKAAQQGEGDA